MYFFRPAPGWSQYATPIDDYYQCGSRHPPRRLRHRLTRRLASQRILRDRARNR